MVCAHTLSMAKITVCAHKLSMAEIMMYAHTLSMISWANSSSGSVHFLWSFFVNLSSGGCLRGKSPPQIKAPFFLPKHSCSCFWRQSWYITHASLGSSNLLFLLAFWVTGLQTCTADIHHHVRLSASFSSWKTVSVMVLTCTYTSTQHCKCQYALSSDPSVSDDDQEMSFTKILIPDGLCHLVMTTIPGEYL